MYTLSINVDHMSSDQTCLTLVSFADNNPAQLEDPFGYDKADIKVDAIVEDLKVIIPLSPCLLYGNAFGVLFTNAKAFSYQTGRNKCSDRRVEKELRHVHWVEY